VSFRSPVTRFDPDGPRAPTAVEENETGFEAPAIVVWVMWIARQDDAPSPFLQLKDRLASPDIA
jgi:hypothetical protein